MDDYKQLQMIENIKRIKEMEILVELENIYESELWYGKQLTD